MICSDNIITFDSDVSIPNVYTKSEVDALIAGGGEPIDAYTKDETDGLLALKANAADVYTKTDSDERYQGKISTWLNVNGLSTSFSQNADNQNACLVVGGRNGWYNANIVSARNSFMAVGGTDARVKFWDAFDHSWLAIGPSGDATGKPYINGPGRAILTIGPLRKISGGTIHTMKKELLLVDGHHLQLPAKRSGFPRKMS